MDAAASGTTRVLDCEIMNKRHSIFTICLFLLILSSNPILGEINNKQDSIFDLSGKLIKPDRIYKKGIWELQIIYIQKGTRSEGLHGVLIKNDKVLNQKEDNKMIKTDIGVMKYYGKFENRKHNWDISGWCFSDANKIPRPSTKINRNK